MNHNYLLQAHTSFQSVLAIPRRFLLIEARALYKLHKDLLTSNKLSFQNTKGRPWGRTGTENDASVLDVGECEDDGQ